MRSDDSKLNDPVEASAGKTLPAWTRTRWKIALNCVAVAICVLAGAAFPTEAVAAIPGEVITFVKLYGTIGVATIAIAALILVDMAAWPILTKNSRG